MTWRPVRRRPFDSTGGVADRAAGVGDEWLYGTTRPTITPDTFGA